MTDQRKRNRNAVLIAALIIPATNLFGNGGGEMVPVSCAFAALSVHSVGREDLLGSASVDTCKILGVLLQVWIGAMLVLNRHADNAPSLPSCICHAAFVTFVYTEKRLWLKAALCVAVASLVNASGFHVERFAPDWMRPQNIAAAVSYAMTACVGLCLPVRKTD